MREKHVGAGATKMGHLGLVVRGQASSGLGWGALGWGALPGGGGEGRGGGGDRLQLVNTNTCLVSSVTLHHPPSTLPTLHLAEVQYYM